MLPDFTSQEIQPEGTLADELEEDEDDEETLDEELEDELLCGNSDDELDVISALEWLSDELSAEVDELSEEYVLSPPTGFPPAEYSPEPC